jgi:hypothetical protein
MQYPAEKMEEWRVGDAARNPRNDYPEIMNRLQNTFGSWPVLVRKVGEPRRVEAHGMDAQERELIEA